MLKLHTSTIAIAEIHKILYFNKFKLTHKHTHTIGLCKEYERKSPKKIRNVLSVIIGFGLKIANTFPFPCILSMRSVSMEKCSLWLHSLLAHWNIFGLCATLSVYT